MYSLGTTAAELTSSRRFLTVSGLTIFLRCQSAGKEGSIDAVWMRSARNPQSIRSAMRCRSPPELARSMLFWRHGAYRDRESAPLIRLLKCRLKRNSGPSTRSCSVTSWWMRAFGCNGTVEKAGIPYLWPSARSPKGEGPWNARSEQDEYNLLNP